MARNNSFVSESFEFVKENWQFFILTIILLSIPVLNIFSVIFILGYFVMFLQQYIKSQKLRMPQYEIGKSFINGLVVISIQVIYALLLLLSTVIYGIIIYLIFLPIHAVLPYHSIEIIGIIIFAIGIIAQIFIIQNMYLLSVAHYAKTERIDKALYLTQIFKELKSKKLWGLYFKYILYLTIVYLPLYIGFAYFYIHTLHSQLPTSIKITYEIIRYLAIGIWTTYTISLSYIIYGKEYKLRNKIFE